MMEELEFVAVMHGVVISESLLLSKIETASVSLRGEKGGVLISSDDVPQDDLSISSIKCSSAVKMTFKSGYASTKGMLSYTTSSIALELHVLSY